MSAVFAGIAAGSEILKSVLELAATPGGQAILERLFAEHGLTNDKLLVALAALKEPPDPKQ